jgi:predicted GNAT family acetyltransferase
MTDSLISAEPAVDQMFDIQRVDERNKQKIIRYAAADIIKHVFAFYDIQHDPKHTTTYAAFENNSVLGYVLTYTATDVPSIILECKEEVAKALITHIPEDHFIMHTSPDLQSIVKRKFPDANVYLENWMLLRKNEANPQKSKLVKRLQTKEDAALLAQLILARKDRPRKNLNRYKDWITKMPMFGVFEKGKLVSYAGSFIQLREVWMIGGVFTDPEHRNKGYALLATSAVTREALKEAESAALFVRSDNYPAIKVYEKIGYKKIGEKLWIDVGTGLKP